MVAFVWNCSVKMALRLFQPLSVVMTVVPTLLRQVRRYLEIKRLSQILFVCYSLLNSQNISINNNEKGWLLTHQEDTSGVAKIAAEVAQKKEEKLDRGELYPQWKRDSNLDGVQLRNRKHKIQNKTTFLRKEDLF